MAPLPFRTPTPPAVPRPIILSCHQEFFTKTEDRLVVKEVVELIWEHRPVEREFVVRMGRCPSFWLLRWVVLQPSTWLRDAAPQSASLS